MAGRLSGKVGGIGAENPETVGLRIEGPAIATGALGIDRLAGNARIPDEPATAAL